jgi:hypothetical protein
MIPKESKWKRSRKHSLHTPRAASENVLNFVQTSKEQVNMK